MIPSTYFASDVSVVDSLSRPASTAVPLPSVGLSAHSHPWSLPLAFETNRRSMKTERTYLSEPNSAFSQSYEEYNTLGIQFNGFVLVSTFTATLIIAFISLARDNFSFLQNNRSLLFESGMTAALIGTGFHIGVIVIGSRASRICLRLAATLRHPNERLGSRSSLEKYYSSLWNPIAEYQAINFYQYIAYCETMQSFGTTMLILCIHPMMFSMYSRLAFPIVFILATFIGYYWVLVKIGFWKLSVLRETCMIVYHQWKSWMNAGKRKQPVPVDQPESK